MIETSKHQERVILLGVELPDTENFEMSMEELASLAETAGAEVVSSYRQKREKYDSKSLIGSGKLAEIKAIVDDNNRPIFDLESNKVLGREVVESDDVPDGTIIFGDLSEYMFNWSKDATISKSEETAFASGDVVYRILALADGGLADLGAIAVMSKKA